MTSNEPNNSTPTSGIVINLEDYLTKRGQKDTLEFLRTLTTLTPLELVGCAELLKVVAVEVTNEPDTQKAQVSITEDLMSNMIDAFIQLDSKSRRKLLKILRG